MSSLNTRTVIIDRGDYTCYNQKQFAGTTVPRLGSKRKYITNRQRVVSSPMLTRWNAASKVD